MNKGLAIVEINDAGTRSVFVDQDVIECAKLNARIKKRVEAQRTTECKYRKAEAQRARRNAQRSAYVANTVFYVLIRCLVIAAVTWAWMAQLIHPIIYIPVILFCLCTACLRLGACFGRRWRHG